jgi:hypothetical protein
VKQHYLMAVAATVFFGVTGCADGDWLGPMERGLRGAMDGWDMWDTAAVRPYQDPMPPIVEGTVPTQDRYSFETGKRQLAGISPDQRKVRAARAYRRYCHHCHGPNGDGRIIVGESLDIAPTDLRDGAVQSQSDRALFDHLQSGGDLMIPLAATMSPLEMFYAIDHVRSLKTRPTKPNFPAKFEQPIR